MYDYRHYDHSQKAKTPAELNYQYSRIMVRVRDNYIEALWYEYDGVRMNGLSTTINK